MKFTNALVVKLVDTKDLKKFFLFVFFGLAFLSIFNKDFLILKDLKFLSEIICIFFISVVPSARLELALRKRQGF